MTRRVLLTPRAKSNAFGGSNAAAVEIAIDDEKVTEVKLAGLALGSQLATYNENEGAFTLAVNVQPVAGHILLSLPVNGALSMGLTARVNQSASGVFDLTAGVFDGEILAPSPGDPKAEAQKQIVLRRIAFHAAQGLRDVDAQKPEIPVDWIGALRFYGVLEVANVTDWRWIVVGGAPERIPVKVVHDNGRTKISFNPARLPARAPAAW